MIKLEDLLYEGVYDPGILKCIFLAGGPGSGKSKVAYDIFGVAKGLSFSSSGLKVVNSDTAFEAQLKKNGINPRDLSKIEAENPALWDDLTEKPGSPRDKGKKITDKMKSFYEEGRLGMIIDGTGDNVQKIEDQKKRAEELGYDTFMIFVNTSLEVAKHRNSMRDRVLPENLLISIWKECQNNMGKFQTRFGSNFRIVDNSKDGNNVTRDVKKHIDSFINSPIKNQIGKKWVTTQLMLKNANIIK